MITQNDNGSEAMAIINAALQDAGIDVAIGNESGASASGKLNEVFGENVLTSALYGSEWVADVNDGLENLNPPVPHEVMRLLHTSDTHGEVGGLQLCLQMLNDGDVDYLLMSGDLMPYNSTQGSAAYYDNDTLAVVAGTTGGAWSTRGQNDCLMNTNKMLYVAGNHDRFDDDYRLLYGSTFYAKGMQYCTKRWMLDLLGNNVVWGVPDADPTDENYTAGCWWYKDITNGDNTVRVIGIDNYAAVGSSQIGVRHRVFYTQTQVNWLLDLLYNTPSTYHIIMMTHEPPIQTPTSLTTIMRPAAGDTVEERAQKLFVSELYTDFHARGDELQKNLLPTIMRAYIHCENLSMTYQEAGYVNTPNPNTSHTFTLNVSKDFSQLSASANFIGYVCGHAHGDCVGYIPNTEDGWDDQLLMCIAAGGSGIAYSQRDDLLYNINSGGTGTRYASNEPAYRVNELIIDFTAGTLTIKRHGNKTTANVSGRSYGGRVRDEVTFPLKKETIE